MSLFITLAIIGVVVGFLVADFKGHVKNLYSLIEQYRDRYINADNSIMNHIGKLELRVLDLENTVNKLKREIEECK